LSDGTLYACFRLLAADLATKADAGATPPPAALSRSWKWHTTLLLHCPLARQALGAAPLDPPLGSPPPLTEPNGIGEPTGHKVRRRDFDF